MSYPLRDPDMAKKILRKIKDYGLKAQFMHVCGTHQDTLVRFGLDPLLKDAGITVLAGPGCPVCVTTAEEIEETITLAKNKVHVTVYGDMLRVPGAQESLYKIKSQGAPIRVVYSILDAVRYAEKTDNEVVFIGVGFETTAPTTAVTVLNDPPENFSVLCCHRVVPPALTALMELGEINLQGFIQPGHVSTIIGLQPYEDFSKKYRVPQVIAGFEPLDLLWGILMLVRQLAESRHDVENEYQRIVRPEGNKRALAVINQVFQLKDVAWRGFPVIPSSGLTLKEEYSHVDARKRYQELLEPVWGQEWKEPPGCRCGEVLRGILLPSQCPLFGNKCTPLYPVGPCMVSAEGSCQIEYRYKRRTQK
ncbi:MAG: hydrogenase formation protein HypD [Candidatus Ranarchaeia archaeon]